MRVMIEKPRTVENFFRPGLGLRDRYVGSRQPSEYTESIFFFLENYSHTCTDQSDDGSRTDYSRATTLLLGSRQIVAFVADDVAILVGLGLDDVAILVGFGFNGIDGITVLVGLGLNGIDGSSG